MDRKWKRRPACCMGSQHVKQTNLRLPCTQQEQRPDILTHKIQAPIKNGSKLSDRFYKCGDKFINSKVVERKGIQRSEQSVEAFKTVSLLDSDRFRNGGILKGHLIWKLTYSVRQIYSRVPVGTVEGREDNVKPPSLHILHISSVPNGR
jgi:hypothetical protein